MSMDGGVMKMRELKNGLEIPPGATIELKPGSYHIMMMNLSRPLAKGDSKFRPARPSSSSPARITS